MSEQNNDLRYPIGRFTFPDTVTQENYDRWLGDIAALPEHLHDAVRNLTDGQLDIRYRPEGWTLRQVVHHIADSHINSYVRCKLALTEDNPITRPYDESAWAKLPDSRGDIVVSLDVITALHARWVGLLEQLDKAAWQRTYQHEGTGKVVTLERTLALYAWHGTHHVAHITHTRDRHGW